MSVKLKVNLILLAGMVLPPLSYLLMSFDLGMALAAIPVLGSVYPALPFTFLQLLLCYNFRGRFSWLARAVILGVWDAAGIPGIILITFTTLPMLGFGLGWIAWMVLHRRNLL